MWWWIVVAILVIILIANALLCLAVCMLSSDISQDDERR